jgi:hypothetical protein
MSVDITYQPKIVTYWLGWVAESSQAYYHLQGLPDYVDVVTLAFALVQGGELLPGVQAVPLPAGSSPCQGCGPAPGGKILCPATCLLDTAVDPTHTRDNLKSWVKAAKAGNPNLKVLLSIGGSRYCDWRSVTDPQAFANHVRTEISRWNDAGQLVDGVDIDYENADCCGTTFGAQTDTIVVVIEEIAKALAAGSIVSLPIYGGSPQDLMRNLGRLRSCVTYACTMDYSCNLSGYQGYQPQVNWLAMGFDTGSSGNAVTACFNSAAGAGVTLAAGMLWNLGSQEEAPQFLAQLNASLNP